MLACQYVILVLIFLHKIRTSYSCGCYGSKSCTRTGISCYRQFNESCLCDCCPPCNTCEQFIKFNCLAHRYVEHYGLSTNQSDIVAKINEPIIANYIIDQTNGNIIRHLWDPCLSRLLPNGIYLERDNDGKYKLCGIPTRKLEKTHFEILFKGPVSLLIYVSFTITII